MKSDLQLFRILISCINADMLDSTGMILIATTLFVFTWTALNTLPYDLLSSPKPSTHPSPIRSWISNIFSGSIWSDICRYWFGDCSPPLGDRFLTRQVEIGGRPNPTDLSLR